MVTDPRLLLLSPGDNVFVAIQSLRAADTVRIAGVDVAVPQDVPLGFKVAARPIRTREKIVKYGAPIGSATRDIQPGEMVHLHNMKSDYLPTYATGGASFDEPGR